MSLYAALAAVILWGATLIGAYFYGVDVGADREVAAQARDDRIVEKANDAAASAVAGALARIEVKNVTIQQKLEREIRTREVFRDCRSGDAALQLLNATPGVAASGPGAAGGRELPGAGAAR